MPPRVVITADDFGLSLAVNEAVERAHREGVLTAASLMVAGDAAADAIRRAKAMPGLRVGLHLVLVDGPVVVPDGLAPGRVLPNSQVRLAFRQLLRPRALRREVAAQFRAFAASGLVLDHANAHKHMHMHPLVAGSMIAEGRQHGLRAVRVPEEPGSGLWCGWLRRQVRAAGLAAPDAVWGLADTGHMDTSRALAAMGRLRPGLNEIYFHPATERDPLLVRLMPDYDHEGELAALVSPDLRRALQPMRRGGYLDLI
ncbi:MAG: hopanoid biosynthesis-associated protein HpnK [Rhodospirillales bacterium]|nr:hopanoid biosynthesis-associated protein HpnK [Rhodospirillales bacterium]